MVRVGQRLHLLVALWAAYAVQRATAALVEWDFHAGDQEVQIQLVGSSGLGKLRPFRLSARRHAAALVTSSIAQLRSVTCQMSPCRTWLAVRILPNIR